MISSKYVCACIAFAGFILAFQALPAAAFTLQETETETENLLTRLANKQFAGLADELEAHEFFSAAPPGLWQQVVTTVSQAYTVLGPNEPVFGVRKVGQKKFGDTLISNRYAIMFGRQPILFEFWLYKPNEDWQFLNVSMIFGSNIQPVLLRWFDGTD